MAILAQVLAMESAGLGCLMCGMELLHLETQAAELLAQFQRGIGLNTCNSKDVYPPHHNAT